MKIDLKEYTNYIITDLKRWVIRNEPEIRDYFQQNDIDYDYYHGLDALKPEGPICQDIVRMHREGWSVVDAISFFRCTEDIDPRVPEYEGLRKMEKLRNKYKMKRLPFLEKDPGDLILRIQERAFIYFFREFGIDVDMDDVSWVDEPYEIRFPYASLTFDGEVEASTLFKLKKTLIESFHVTNVIVSGHRIRIEFDTAIQW